MEWLEGLKNIIAAFGDFLSEGGAGSGRYPKDPSNPNSKYYVGGPAPRGSFRGEGGKARWDKWRKGEPLERKFKVKHADGTVADVAKKQVTNVLLGLKRDLKRAQDDYGPNAKKNSLRIMGEMDRVQKLLNQIIDQEKQGRDAETIRGHERRAAQIFAPLAAKNVRGRNIPKPKYRKGMTDIENAQARADWMVGKRQKRFKKGSSSSRHAEARILAIRDVLRGEIEEGGEGSGRYRKDPTNPNSRYYAGRGQGRYKRGGTEAFKAKWARLHSKVAKHTAGVAISANRGYPRAKARLPVWNARLAKVRGLRPTNEPAGPRWRVKGKEPAPAARRRPQKIEHPPDHFPDVIKLHTRRAQPLRTASGRAIRW